MSLWMCIARSMNITESYGGGRWLRYCGALCFRRCSSSALLSTEAELQRTTWYTISACPLLLKSCQVFRWSASPQEIHTFSTCVECGPRLFTPTQHVFLAHSWLCPTKVSWRGPCPQPIKGLSGGPWNITKPWWSGDIYPPHVQP